MFESLMVPLGASGDTYDTRDVSFIDTCLAKLSLKETGATIDGTTTAHLFLHVATCKLPNGFWEMDSLDIGNIALSL